MSESSEAAETTAPADPYRITICRIREWGACQDGRDWFRGKFPEGASYGETIEALLADGRRSDAAWLDYRVIDAWGSQGEFIAQAVADQIRITTQDAGEPDTGDDSRLAASSYASRLAASGYDSRLAASGDDSRLAASGDDSRLAASGNASRLAASGDDSRLAASGYDSRLAASGYTSRLAASGNDSSLAASGNDSSLAASGYTSRLAASGYDSRLTLGPHSCGAAVWWDGSRSRFATCTTADGDLSPGEQRVKIGVRYRVNGVGQFVEDV